MLLGRTLGLFGSIGAMPPHPGVTPCPSPAHGWHERGRGGLHKHVQAPAGCTRVCKAHPEPDSATWPPLEAAAGAGAGGAGGAGRERRSPRRARPCVISAEPQRGAGANRPFHPFSYRGDCSLFPVKPRREPAPSCWRRGRGGGDLGEPRPRRGWVWVSLPGPVAAPSSRFVLLFLLLPRARLRAPSAARGAGRQRGKLLRGRSRRRE